MKEVDNSKLIVFSDYYLEEEMNGAEIPKNVKEKGIDATVIIMSDTTKDHFIFLWGLFLKLKYLLI